MSASHSRPARPALPDPNERDHARDRIQRRAPDRARSAAGRQPRANLDALAIGAPLTAALVGVLLAEGGAALGEAGLAADPGPGGAARRGDGDASSTTDYSVALGRLDAAGAGVRIDGSSASTSGEIFDPVAAGEAAATEVPSGEVAGGLAPPAAGSAALAAKAAVGGAINITVGGAGAPVDGLGLASSSSDAGADSSGGRIGSVINGTDGDDVIHGTPFDDRLFGGPGNDTIYGYEGDDLLDGGPGDDRLFGGPGNDQLLGGEGDDRAYGGTGDDLLFGGSGNDRLFGEEGRDRLDGGSGDDLLDGGPGADRMVGGSGDDLLIVDHLHDVALENRRGPDGGGDDVLEIGAGFADHLPDDVDSVTFVFSEGLGTALPSDAAAYRQQVGVDIEHVTLEGSADHDVIGDSSDNRLTGNTGDNLLHGGDGDDTLLGGGGDDELKGDSGHDLLRGGEGDDVLKGGSGKDELYGGADNDILDGGGGRDLLYGGAGDDNFMLGLNENAVDTVFDHEGHNRLTIEDGGGHRVQTAVGGDQLYVVVHNNVVGVVDGYPGNQDAFEGIDTGAGLYTIDELMAPGAGHGPALASASSAGGSALEPEPDLLDPYLTRPNLHGTAGADHLVGTSASDWLSGSAGNDHLLGSGGRDVLEGGAGSDVLEGGAGDDRYLVKTGQAGWDVIRDTEGSNVVELDGFAGAKLNGLLVGKDLVVVANNAPVFTYEDFASNPEAFGGVRVGDEVVSAEDLLG
jgi:Ca2+-binding RTX toxin-like protein